MEYNLYGIKVKVDDNIKPFGMFANLGNRSIKGAIMQTILELQAERKKSKEKHALKIPAGQYTAKGYDGTTFLFDVL
jgi:hypothetical protein